MYPKNAAAPEPIAIGAVVQISDGAVQTSGCTVRVKPIGVAEGDGGGTTAYSTDGIVLYTPTQAETNYTSFVLIAKKTGCIPVSVTVVTTASSVPGRTMPADGSITADVIAANAIDASALATDAVTEIQSGLSTLTASGVRTAVGMASANLDEQLSNVPTVAEFEARTIVAANYATAANLLIVSDGVGFMSAVLMGSCSDAGTAGETYVITFGGATYTTDYTGLDSTGNRTATTRTKS